MSSTNKTISQKTDELNQIIAWFDSEDFSLEMAIDNFKKAQEIAISIENDLNSIKNEVNILKEKFDSEV